MCKHIAAKMGKSGLIWNTKPKTGQMGTPGELFFHASKYTRFSANVHRYHSNSGYSDVHLGNSSH